MNIELVEKCAEALWKEYIRDPANRHHLNKLFGPNRSLTWRDANDPDIVPMFADQFRTRAKVVLEEARKFLMKNTAKLKDDRALIEIYDAMRE